MQRRPLWLIAGIAGASLVVLGVGGGLLALALVLVGGGNPAATDTLPVAGLLALGLGLGLPLSVQGWAGWLARPSRPFRLSHGGWMWLALVFLIGLGTAVSVWSLAPGLLLPPVHAIVMVLLPLVVLGLVGKPLQGRGGSWREVIAGMAGGGYLGVGGSLLAEGLVAFTLAICVATVVGTTPGGPERIASLLANLQDPAWVADVDNVLRLLLSPAIAISVLGLFTIPVPLIEEALKTLAAGVAARWVRPHPARAFLWGVAGGAGFALAENLFNGALGGAESWGLGAIARFGATVMHCCTGALVGWGWGQCWTARRPLRLLGSYLLAVIVHGLWNAATVSAVLLSASTLSRGKDGAWSALAGLGTMAILGLLGALTLAFMVALPWLGRKLALQDGGLQ
jgi:hypothetical protein